MKNLYQYLLFFAFFTFIFFSGAISAKSFEKKIFANDSLILEQKKQSKEIATLEKNKKYFNENSISRKQNHILSKIDASIREGSLVLKKGIDYKYLVSSLKSIKKIKVYALQTVLQNPEKIQSVRNVTLTSTTLNEILSNTEEQLKKIDGNQKALTNCQTKIDSLIINPVLYQLPSDSKTREIYLEKLNSITKDVDKINTRFKGALDSINKVQFDARAFKFELQNDILETDKLRAQMQENIFSQRHSLFTASSYTESVASSFTSSFIKEFFLVLFYVGNHTHLFLFMILGTLIIGTYLKILKNKYKTTGLLGDFKYRIQLFNHPFIVASVISVTITHFFFNHPPFSFLCLIWIFLLIAFRIVSRKTNSQAQKKYWRINTLLILCAFFSNNLLLPSFGEVVFLLLLSLATISLHLWYFIKHRENYREIYRGIFIAISTMQFIGLIFLLIGNYNLGKAFIVTGLITVFLTHILLFTLSKTLDIFRYSDYIQTQSADEKSEINLLEYESHEISSLRYIILFSGWFVLIFRGTYWYQSTTKPISEALTKERNIGDFTYSFQNILFFFAVIISAVVISKIVSFISTTNQEKTEKKQLGSWLLLIRIGIVSSGIIMAFVIAGFPLDRITMILSALGVGIGLGLQSITNNLVSGIILAFEKPVNIGDIIEMNGQTGQMKSIGIRSSIIKTFDGADVIMPNGELLNQNVTNWTLSSNKRRYEITIGVEYGTNLMLAKTTLEEILGSNDSILTIPEPIVWVTDFDESSINLVVKYWVAHFLHGNDVKSDLILKIDAKFRELGINIPFPHREIIFKNFPENSQQDNLE